MRTMRKKPVQRLSPIQKRRLKKVCSIMAVTGLLWLLFAPGSGVVSLLRQRAALEQLQEETARLRIQNEQLQEEIKKLKDDPDYLEQVARRDFGLLKKNERVYDFSKPEKKEK